MTAQLNDEKVLLRQNRPQPSNPTLGMFNVPPYTGMSNITGQQQGANLGGSIHQKQLTEQKQPSNSLSMGQHTSNHQFSSHSASKTNRVESVQNGVIGNLKDMAPGKSVRRN
mmetsp:Transcript_18753/g.32057  ORF Transcript_18753/g.32057 Transcript_18753/m.32057 type:complete len:112 (+) Transcript_18753:311-646(+)